MSRDNLFLKNSYPGKTEVASRYTILNLWQCTQIIYSCCKVLRSSCFDVIAILLMLLLNLINYLKCSLCSMLLRYCCDVADALIKLVLKCCQSLMLLQNNCDVAHAFVKSNKLFRMLPMLNAVAK